MKETIFLLDQNPFSYYTYLQKQPPRGVLKKRCSENM